MELRLIKAGVLVLDVPNHGKQVELFGLLARHILLDEGLMQ